MSDYELLIALLMKRYIVDEDNISQRDAESLIDLLDGLARVNEWELS